MGIIVAISTVADGTMYNRRDDLDSQVIHNRKVFLEKNAIAIEQTTRLRISYDRSDYLRYMELDTSFVNHGMTDTDAPMRDAIITTATGQALFLPIADCIGAIFYDPVAQVMALAHLGRHSLEQQGGREIVAYLQATHHANPKDMQVWLTPAPSKDTYPIWALDNKGMKEAALEQLFAAGILHQNITDNSAESDKDQQYYSYSESLKGDRTKDGSHAIVAMMTP